MDQIKTTGFDFAWRYREHGKDKTAPKWGPGFQKRAADQLFAPERCLTLSRAGRYSRACSGLLQHMATPEEEVSERAADVFADRGALSIPRSPEPSAHPVSRAPFRCLPCTFQHCPCARPPAVSPWNSNPIWHRGHRRGISSSSRSCALRSANSGQNKPAKCQSPAGDTPAG